MENIAELTFLTAEQQLAAFKLSQIVKIMLKARLGLNQSKLNKRPLTNFPDLIFLEQLKAV